MTALNRTMRPAPAYRLEAVLRADDDAATRARNIIDLLGLSGDPAVIAQHEAVVRDILQHYSELDHDAPPSAHI